ncbi:hypothetical protein FRC10_005061, partial [Ceratobasidium sp. 414]
MPRISSALRRVLREPRVRLSAGPYTRKSTHAYQIPFPCPYCSRILGSERSRTQHIDQTPGCSKAEALSMTRQPPPWAGLGVDLEPELEPEPEPELDEAQVDEEGGPGCQTPDAGSEGRGEGACEATETLVGHGGGLRTAHGPLVGSVDGGRKLVFDEGVFVEYFPDSRAGAPINDKVTYAPDINDYMAAAGNLSNPTHFATAELLLTTGLTAAGRTTHLQSHMYVGRTPWKSDKMLMDDLDKLPHGPGWWIYEMVVDVPQHGPQNSYLFTRHIIEVVCDIMADPSFEDDMRFTAERRWEDEACTNRIYGDSWTTDWWWRMQLRIPDKFATIVPLIISSDRTSLSTMAGGQEAYPVYITVANIKKSVRRETNRKATALLAYLPVDDFENAPNAQEKSRLKHTLTHRAMEKIAEPLRTASNEGIEMLCADGRFRRGYPIVAGEVLDWKEQCVHACILESRCTKCKKEGKGRGDNTLAPARSSRETLEALSKYFNGGTLGELNKLGLKPWWPWWANLPYVDFHASLMPDLLHQLHQGMIKRHVMGWLEFAMGKHELDGCFIAMPQAEGMRHFGEGISKLAGRWTGRESREVTRQLLPIVAGQPSSRVDPNLVRIIRAILEFTYRAHASRMTDKDLDRLQAALDEFHQYKRVLVGKNNLYQSDSRFDLIAKLHQLHHYPGSTREMGTPDGFSTEGPEHMHIESAKVPWRASNKVRPTQQMVKFVQRYEALRIHRAYMDRFLGVTSTGRGPRKSRVVYGEEVEGPTPKGNVGKISGEGGGEGEGEGKDAEEDCLEREDEVAEGEKVPLEGGRATLDANEH